MRKILCVLLISSIFYPDLQAQDKVLFVGEELIYKVYFGFIRLGQVKFKLTSKYNEGKNSVYTARAEIKSYEGVPFVAINFIFETEMLKHIDKEEVYSKTFYSTEFKNKSMTRIEYKFDYQKDTIRVQKETDGEITNFQKYPILNNAKYQDGLSLFYNARMQSFSNTNYIIPVFINEQESSVKYSFNMNQDVVKADATNYDIATIRVAGVADFVGVFGLTGEFTSWLSADEARVPVKAQFNVMIGSITLELEKYKRTLWDPPRFVN